MKFFLKILFVFFLLTGLKPYAVEAYTASSITFDRFLPNPITSVQIRDGLKKSTTSRVSIKTRHIMGELGETTMDRFFKGPGKWSKFSGQVGSHGIDGLYVRWDKNGKPKVLVVESKHNTSQLSQKAKKGPQMSKESIKISIDKKIESLRKKPKSYKITKEIENLTLIKKAYMVKQNRTVIFKTSIHNSKLRVSVTGVQKHIINGQAITKSATLKRIPIGTRNSVWKGKEGNIRLNGQNKTIRYKYMDIPLETKDFNKLKNTLTKNEFNYLKQFRDGYFEDLTTTLNDKNKTPLTKQESTRVAQKLKNGEIKNSRELNHAIDEKIFQSKNVVWHLKKRNLGLTESQTTRILKLSKINFLNRPAIINKVVESTLKMNAMKNSTIQTFGAVKNYKQTTRTMVESFKKINYNTVSENLKTPKFWGNVGKGVSKALVVVAIAVETYRWGKMTANYYNGNLSTENAYLFVGSSSTGLAVGWSGMKIGAKIGAKIGSKFHSIGIVVGGIIGGAVGSISGYLLGDYTGGIIAKSIYTNIYDLENEGFQQEYVQALKTYSLQKI